VWYTVVYCSICIGNQVVHIQVVHIHCTLMHSYTMHSYTIHRWCTTLTRASLTVLTIPLVLTVQVVHDTDEGIRPGTTVEGLGKLKDLKSLQSKGKTSGMVTAGTVHHTLHTTLTHHQYVGHGHGR
jgi:hypothetical protein